MTSSATPRTSPNSSTGVAIKLINLTRTYQSYRKGEGLKGSIRGFFRRDYQFIEALKPTSLEIATGTIIGLVGANGAGKTTLLKLLSGLIFPTTGTAQVLGFEPWHRNFQFLRQISILLGQKNQLWWDLAPIDSFRLLASIYEIPWSEAVERFTYLSELLHCRPMLQVQLRRLSLGERMKMEIIGALLHHPAILYLDEPTIGLDVVAQTTIREFLKTYSKEHRPTIILTSHYMDDIAELAERLLIINSGAIVYDGTVTKFIERAGRHQNLVIVLDRSLDTPIHVPGSTALLPAGQDIIQIQTIPEAVPVILQEVAKHRSMREIRTESVGFEEIIREYFAAANGVQHRSE